MCSSGTRGRWPSTLLPIQRQMQVWWPLFFFSTYLIINLHHHCHCPNTKESSLSTNLLKSGLNCSFKGEDMISPTGLRAWRIMYRSTFEETEHLYICRRLCYKHFTHFKIRVLTMKALARKDGRIFWRKSKSPNLVVQVTYDKRKVNKGLVVSPFHLLNFLSYSTKTSRVEEREMKKDEKDQNYVNPQQRLFIFLFLV